MVHMTNLSCNETIVNLDDLFKKPQITPYGFMRLFFATLTKKGKDYILRKNLVSNIYKLSEKKEYEILVKEIGFNVFIDSVRSQEIEDGIACLQTFGLAGKLNPSYEKIINFISPNEAKKIINEYESEITKRMDSFVKDYIKISKSK